MPARWPTFLGIGAQKTGTTWLHSMLRLHPDIGMPVQKELHFWDRQEPEPAAIEAYCTGFDALHGRARGEITPSYAILPPARIAVLRRRLPELRLLYIVRNPLERAWSQARMELARRGGEPDDLSAWLTAQFRSAESLARGDYAHCLENWYAHYPHEQLKVFVYEEVFADPRGFLKTCANHLRVDAEFYEGVKEVTLKSAVYPEQAILQVERREMPESLKAEHAALLHSLYAPRIEALGALMGRDLKALWLSA